MTLRTLFVAALGAAAIVAPANAAGARSVGTPEQIAWVRHAAERFVSAELSVDGAEACAVLNAPMRAVIHGTSCERRWNSRIRRMLRRPGARAELRHELRAIPRSRVVVHGTLATITLPEPLISGPNRLRWTENCWMLEG